MKFDAQPGSAEQQDAIPAGCVYQFGAFELNPDAYELRRRGLRMRTRSSSIDLLLLLIQRRGTLVTREEITARLWAEPTMVDVDQGINAAIRRIRELLNDDPTNARFIETVVGKGYRFIAEVKEVRSAPAMSPVISDPDDEPQSPTASVPLPAYFAEPLPVTTAPLKPRSVFRIASIGILAALCLVVFGFLLEKWHRPKPAPAAYNPSLVQITTNDSELRVIAAAISPDGKWIAYSEVNSLYLRLLDSEKVVPLKQPANLTVERIAWFPDQTRLLVSGFDTKLSDYQIWSVFITGGSPQLLRKDARNGLASPDGTSIAFTARKGKELWIAGAAGEGARPLLVDKEGKSFSAIFWSADGRRLSYERSMNGLTSRDFESADATTGNVLVSKEDFPFDSGCALKDGRIYLLRDSPAGFRSDYSLWEIATNPATGAVTAAPKQVASFGQGRASALTMSDDGNRSSIVFEKGSAHVFVGALRQPGPTLNAVKRLTFDTKTDYPGSWLHDSQTVVFESDRTGIFRLYEQKLQAATAQELETGRGPAVLPQVTPDGKWILYLVSPGTVTSQTSRIFRIPAAGGAPVQVPLNQPVDEFRCPLRGNSGCVLRETEGEKSLVYYALDPVAGKGRRLARTAWLPHVNSDWSVAPDGLAIALTIHDPGDPRIRIVPLDGNESHKEREMPVKGYGRLSGLTWAADGKGWYVAADTQAGTSILYVNEHGQSHVLLEAPTTTWSVPSPDGSKLAFVDRTVDSNVWMWQADQRR